MDNSGKTDSSGKTEKSYVDTVPISNFSEVLRNIRNASNPIPPFEPERGTLVEFARLTPSNRAACRAFDAIAREIQANEEWNQHHRQYIVISDSVTPPEPVTLNPSRSNGTAPPESLASFSDILQSRLLDEEASDSDTQSPEPVETFLTGYYRLSLDIAPQFARIGWRIGSGRPRHSNDAVDLLLTKPGHHNVGVAGSHARFQFERRSGALLLVANNFRGTPVVLNGQRFAHDMRVIGRPRNTIEFGDLTYSFEYMIKGAKEEKRYQESLQTYFEFAYGSQPDPSSSATPSAHDRELGDYILRNTLARGGSGIVSVANHIKTGTPVAVKEILRTRWNYQRVAQEIEISRSLKHERLADVYDVFYERGETTYRTRDSPERIYLFLTLAQGTFRALFTPLVKYDDRIEFFRQGLEGLAFLHREGIMHRDIKPANLAVKEFDPPNAFIIDLGCATQERTSNENAGTIPYLAPELRAGSVYDRAVDIWSYGAVGLELFLLRRPVVAGTPRLDADTTNRFHSELTTKSKGNASIENLLLQMLTWDATQRITAANAMQHESLVREIPKSGHLSPDVELPVPRKRFDSTSSSGM